jgi:hypothetical protein
MHTNKPLMLLLATGLLIAAATSILSRYVKIPDMMLGSFMGLGIGLEIVAIIKLKKLNRQKAVTKL